MPLTATFVKQTKKIGRHGDGRNSHGLALIVRRRADGSLSKTWTQRIAIKGRRTNLGLGIYPLVSLAAARAQATENAQVARDGGDPRHIDKAPTFKEAAERVIELHRDGWSDGGRSEKQWRSSLNTYAHRLNDKPVTEVTGADVLAVLTPIWNTKPETARRLRGRISAVMKWAIAEGHRIDNPAGDAVAAALPRHTTRPQHHRALPHSQVGAALAAVDASSATPSVKHAMVFLTITACRSGEVRGARWSEIDLSEKVWTIPASRTKTGMQHRVPLSTRAIEVLNEAREDLGDDGFVFPSPTGKVLSDNTLSKLFRGLNLDGTPHGMRAAFRSWCSDMGQPRELAEAALGHVVRGVEAAYARSDMLERRRPMMQEWSDYLQST
ncbi:MAG: tyrosine-type recombinase/integrase [Acidimicrobiaceae bacterium]|nr:tyrosine-type recombinase/integrase [Acidimicrobiaceae bacterium]MYI37004.1 tyrosine-type recombinase/integrase [Acidimicrobiaceae bacterium]